MSRRPNVAMSQRRDVPTSQRSRDSYIKIIKRMGDLIFEIIEGRTDEVRETKQEQPERSKRLVFLYFSSQNH